MQAVGTIEVREHDLLVSGDHAIVLNSWHITSDDRDQWLNNAVIYHTSDGKITELWTSRPVDCAPKCSATAAARIGSVASLVPA